MTDTIQDKNKDKEKNMILSRAALAAREALKKDPNLTEDKLIEIINRACSRWIGIYSRMNKPVGLLDELKTMFSSPLPDTTLSEIYKRAANYSTLDSTAEKHFKALQKKLEENSKTIIAPNVIDELEKLIAQLQEPDERLLGTRNLKMQVGEYKEIIISDILRQLDTTQSSDNNVLNETIIKAVNQIRGKIKEGVNNLTKFDQKVKTELLRIIGDPEINIAFLREIQEENAQKRIQFEKDVSEKKNRILNNIIKLAVENIKYIPQGNPKVIQDGSTEMGSALVAIETSLAIRLNQLNRSAFSDPISKQVKTELITLLNKKPIDPDLVSQIFEAAGITITPASASLEAAPEVSVGPATSAQEISTIEDLKSLKKALTESGLTNENKAKYLRGITEGNRALIGEYLGESDIENVAVLTEFAKTFDFKDKEFDVALREYLSTFKLPGEAQKNDRIVEAFAKSYFSANNKSENNKFNNEDAVYTLAFSTIMLNTDAHSPSIKKENKMTQDQFIKNNKGTNNSQDFDPEFLKTLYQNIKKNEINFGHVATVPSLNPNMYANILTGNDFTIGKGTKQNTFTIIDSNNVLIATITFKTEKESNVFDPTKTSRFKSSVSANEVKIEFNDEADLEAMKKVMAGTKNATFKKMNGEPAASIEALKADQKDKNELLVQFKQGNISTAPSSPALPEKTKTPFQSLITDWTNLSVIKQTYLHEKRSKIPVFNILQSREANKISGVRQEQLERLRKASEDAMRAYNETYEKLRIGDPNDDKANIPNPEDLTKKAQYAAAKVMLGAIGTLQAELKKEPNYLGSRLDKMLVDMEKQVRENSNLNKDTMDVVKKQGIVEFTKDKEPEAPNKDTKIKKK
jgi:hypothetical protein